MPKTDPRVDAYIAKSEDFAKPILNHLRQLAHKASPHIQETIKWGMPHFLHKGILFGIAGFKHHCTLHFWNGKLVFGKGFKPVKKSGMGQFGRITALSDLPANKVLLGLMKRAAELNEAGIKKPAPKTSPKKKLIVPRYFLAALKKNKKAFVAFQNFSHSHKKEYAEWIAEAKRPETRTKRIATALQWLAGGKPRHWKYVRP